VSRDKRGVGAVALYQNVGSAQDIEIIDHAETASPRHDMGKTKPSRVDGFVRSCRAEPTRPSYIPSIHQGSALPVEPVLIQGAANMNPQTARTTVNQNVASR
jgi:hypothetical protein